jgi:putative colanic acid biosynthesis acetyltransferase WcaF
MKSNSFYPHIYRSELSFRNKLGRLIWNIVWVLLFRSSPRIFFGWRRFLLRLFGAKLASSAVVYPSAKIWAPWNLEMGDRSVLGDHVDCYSVDRIIVDADATVSQYAFLCTASHDIESPDRSLIHKPIRVERGSWVFAGAFIAMGVVVGEGSIVAARSVVTKSVEPFSIVGGNPAKFIKERKVDWIPKETAG